MTPDVVVIFKLIGDVISKGGKKGTDGINKVPTLPGEVQRRIDSYPMTFRAADDLLVTLLASFELAWEKAVRPLTAKDENRLLSDYGVNSFSKATTSASVDLMLEDREQLRELSQRCDAVNQPFLLALRSASSMGLKASGLSSQPAFDGVVIQRITQVCSRMSNAIEQIVRLLEKLIDYLQRELAVKPKYGPAF
jgi:hypothetical protein